MFIIRHQVTISAKDIESLSDVLSDDLLDFIEENMGQRDSIAIDYNGKTIGIYLD